MHLYDWIVISKSKNLSEEFIRENQNNLEWKYIIWNQSHLTEEFWFEFKHKIEEVDKLLVQGFSDDFIQEFRADDGWSAFLIDTKLVKNSLIVLKIKINGHGSLFLKIKSCLLDLY